ncbi:fatty acyl-AMP ligase [Variovorax sp. OV700]|uniref:fatty acyl-AMP ligase n=1 Tax=Variovorax sp. OV700 TaxID=1882826 RepID=UPI001587108F|nr:fatty acyl-AMP ligase [Variovorax sp. OV700]
MNLLTVLKNNAEKKADKTAFVYLHDGEDETSRISTGALWRSAISLAAVLRRHADRGDRVLLAVPDGIDFVVLFLACLHAEVIAVPVKPPQNKEASRKVLSIARNSEAVAVVCSGAMIHRLRSFFPEDAALQGMHHLEFEALLSDADSVDASTSQAVAESALSIGSDFIAYLQYTSGSTGDPKGVAVSHANVMANEAMIQLRWRSTVDDVCLSWLPMFHDMGLIAAVLHSVYLGATCILMPPMAFVQKPARWMSAVAKYAATITGGPNFALRAICSPRAIDASRHLDLSSLRVVYCGSEPISAAIVCSFIEKYVPMRFDSRAFSAGYGMAEATLMVSAGGIGSEPIFARAQPGKIPELVDCAALRRGQEDFLNVVISCGELLRHQTVRIVSPDSLRVLEDGHVGEIWIHGPHIGQGYWQNAEATREIFEAQSIEEPSKKFLRTGDLGFMLQGQLFVTGRIKELMIFNGTNFYPQDIEESISGCHEALSLGRSTAFSLQDAGAESLIVIQEINRDHARNLSDSVRTSIEDAIRSTVYSRFSLPIRQVVLVRLNSIPRTTSGKICRVSCKRQFEHGQLELIDFPEEAKYEALRAEAA